MEGAAEVNTATHDGKSLALAIFEEFLNLTAWRVYSSTDI